MDSELYTLTLRALLHGQNSYEMVEQLKESLNFNEEFHHKILLETENCIEYAVEASLERQQKGQRFVLQISRSDDGPCAIQETIIGSESTSKITLRHGRCSLMRVFTAQIDSNEEYALKKPPSFLKRLCRPNGGTNVLLTLKIKNLTVDQKTKFQLNSSPKATLILTLKQNLTDKDLKELNFVDFKHLVKCLYCLVLKNMISWDFVFDVLKSVAVFYDFPNPTCTLLLLGVVIGEKSLEHFSFILQRYFQHLRSATLNKSNHCVDAALFLAERLTNFTRQYLKNSSHDVFFPIDSQQQSHVEFYILSDNLSSILDVAHLGIWDFNDQTQQLPITLSKIFETRLQRSVKAWLYKRLSEENTMLNCGMLSDTVDELHVVLRLCSPLYQSLFQRVWLSYLKTVVNVIEDPLCHLCEETLLIEISILSDNTHDNDKLFEFSKESMKLFDALHQFVEFITSHGQVTRLQKFETWFEKAAVFWTSNWRVIYLNFIKKSIEAVENGDHTVCDLTGNYLQKIDVELHESTFNCLAFCKALCDDYVRLQIHNIDISLICVLQIIPILTDCLNLFAVQVFQQLKRNTTISNMLKSSNGIEHACNHLITNFERFLQLGTLFSRLESEERDQIVGFIRRQMMSTEKRCKQLSTEIVNLLCRQNFGGVLKKHCAQITTSNEMASRRRFRNYVSQVFVSDGGDQLLLFLDKLCVNFKFTLLPRLHSVAMNFLWIEIRDTFTEQLAQGQPSEYYEQINRCCQIICRTIGIDWLKDNGPLREILHLNKADTKELILQYYSKLCDLCANSRPTSGTPRIHIRIGYVQTTNRQILLHIYALCAYDIPILDTLTQSSDPYLRLELYPRYLFPLSQFPAQTSETRKQTLQPKWNQAFEIAVPEEYFFMNGVSLCLTVLDYDIVSYNDMAGQTFLALASIPKLKSLSSKHLPPPIVLPLTLPNQQQYDDEHFRILEQRSKNDKLAKEFICYETYIRRHRLLPPCAEDDKENRISTLKNPRKIKRMLSQIFRKT